MSDLIKALNSKTRRQILKLLSKKEMHISGLARELEVSVPVALKHVRILEDAGLVARKKVGNTHFVSILEEAVNRLEGIWWMIDSSSIVEVRKGATMLDALKLIPGIHVKKTKNGYFIDSVDDREGYYIYEVNGRLIDKAIDEYLIENDSVVELKRLIPVLGKKIRIIVSDKKPKGIQRLT